MSAPASRARRTRAGALTWSLTVAPNLMRRRADGEPGGRRRRRPRRRQAPLLDLGGADAPGLRPGCPALSVLCWPDGAHRHDRGTRRHCTDPLATLGAWSTRRPCTRGRCVFSARRPAYAPRTLTVSWPHDTGGRLPESILAPWCTAAFLSGRPCLTSPAPSGTMATRCQRLYSRCAKVDNESSRA